MCNYGCNGNMNEACGGSAYFNVYTMTGKNKSIFFLNLKINYYKNRSASKDEIIFGSPCKNGGRYFVNRNSSACLCSTQYEGDYCQYGN